MFHLIECLFFVHKNYWLLCFNYLCVCMDVTLCFLCVYLMGYAFL